jgi:hypothetical protein
MRAYLVSGCTIASAASGADGRGVLGIFGLGDDEV